MKHWQDTINGFLGAWLILSPWALGFGEYAGTNLTMAAIGLGLMAAAAGAVFVPRAWEEWTELGLGLLTLASPWVLGFAAEPIARSAIVVTGLVVVALAAWVLATDEEVGFGWKTSGAR